MAVLLPDIEAAAQRLDGVVKKTLLQYNDRLSQQYNAKIYLKREDTQIVRSFKIRGAYNKISSLSADEKKRGVVCASAGNHAQGVAYSCAKLQIRGAIFMPAISPTQKVDRVRHFGGEFVEIVLVGSNFDEALAAALEYERTNNAVFVHPFNDEAVIAGQGTIAKEIDEELDGNVDMVIACVGGGGLVSGIASYFKAKKPEVLVLGSEPLGAAEMHASLQAGHLVTLEKIDTFVDGAAMKAAGEITFDIVRRLVDDIKIVPEGKVCKEMVDLYQNEGIVVEPAGALAVSALDQVADQIAGKTVVCTVSGGNNDILRYPEILERSLVYQGLKHYFIVEFAQRPGQLRQFLEHALGAEDDIVRFEYVKKTNKEKGPALVGIEIKKKDDLKRLKNRMDAIGINYRHITPDDIMYQFLI
ncbi:MAG: threonine ammonia-lyase IlvA [Patescibacteria group bacterium]|nr:threonine ammonia-lyase IlvA [Patescibacteria group bacterium]